MRKSKIVYNPHLSIKENAENNHVKESAIRWYIRVNGIDRKRDNAIVLQRKILELKRKHPDITNIGIATKLSISINTVRKYLKNKVEASNIDSNKLSTFDTSARKFIISSVSTSQDEILSNILRLHVKRKQYDCDFTYSIGNFYKHIPQPQLKFDKYPQVDNVLQLELAYELENESLHSAIIDLPFVIKNNLNEDSYQRNKMVRRFNTFQSPKELYEANDAMLNLSYNKLARKGWLIVKTMDVNFAGKQHWVANYILNKATELGFEMIDQFILVAKSRVLRADGCVQHHSRKFHSYFLVFKKK